MDTSQMSQQQKTLEIDQETFSKIDETDSQSHQEGYDEMESEGISSDKEQDSSDEIELLIHSPPFEFVAE
jgi:hypothetical protein